MLIKMNKLYNLTWKNNFIHKVNSCYLTPNEVEILKKYKIL